MFAGEYVSASFHDVCSVIDDAVRTALQEPSLAGLQAPDHLRHISATVASKYVKWPDPASPARSFPAEIRIIHVQSGLPAKTELMVVTPPEVPRGEARRFLEILSGAVDRSLGRLIASSLR